MKRRRTFPISKLPRCGACGASLLALSLVAITWTVSGEQVKQRSERDAGRSAPLVLLCQILSSTSLSLSIHFR